MILKNKNIHILAPCIRQCKLVDGFCTGCKRSEKELSDWFWMTDEQKLLVTEQLKTRSL